MTEDKVQAGEREAVKASEEVIRRNVKMILEFTNETRKMLLELRNMFDVLQGHVMNQKHEVDELRRQLSFVQQRQAAGGTKVYTNGD